MEYVIVVEKSQDGFGAYVPDLSGCVALGETGEETLLLIREVVEFHIESLRDHGEEVPVPSVTVEKVAV